MAYPVSYPFKTRIVNATSTTSNTIMSVAVSARAKLIGAFYATTSGLSHTAVGTASVAVNGTAVSGMLTTVTTTTGTLGTDLGTPSVATFVNPTDILSVTLSSCVGGNTSFVLREF
jgi:hypothetical protein